MQEMFAKGAFAILAGIFTIVCAAADFDFFMGNRKAKFFVNLMGREGARFFYAVLGFIMCGLGVFMLR